MIASVSGVLSSRAGDTIVVQTDGGVGYAVTVTAGVAERLVLELQDKFGDVSLESHAPRAAGAEEAVRALMGLGYGPVAADDAVRLALTDGASQETSQLIRRALQELAAARGGR